MPYLDTYVYDNGLTVFDNQAVTVHVCSAEPTAFADVATMTLGNQSGITAGAPATRSGGGRRITVPAVTSGTVTGAGTQTATSYAVVDPAANRLLVAAPLAAPQSVTNGNPFTLAAFDVGIPSPVAAP